MTHYVARVTREGDNWLAEVSDLPGAHAFARTLTGLRSELADAVILADDLPDDAEPDIRLVVDEDAVDPDLVRAREALDLANRRRELNVAVEVLVGLTAQESVRLSEAGWSVRDIAGALDISPGRVSQLTSSTKAGDDRATSWRKDVKEAEVIDLLAALQRSVERHRQASSPRATSDDGIPGEHSASTS